jgi:hypothetical protein
MIPAREPFLAPVGMMPPHHPLEFNAINIRKYLTEHAPGLYHLFDPLVSGFVLQNIPCPLVGSFSTDFMNAYFGQE